jgi:hypothetical protein
VKSHDNFGSSYIHPDGTELRVHPNGNWKMQKSGNGAMSLSKNFKQPDQQPQQRGGGRRGFQAGGPGSGRHKGDGSYTGRSFNQGDKVSWRSPSGDKLTGVVNHVYDDKKNDPPANANGRLVEVDHVGHTFGSPANNAGGSLMNHREGDLQPHSGAIGVGSHVYVGEHTDS